MSYLLGLIGPKIHRDLHLIRRIRNEFAHVSIPITFDDQNLANRCGGLYHDSYGKKVAPRVKFCRVVMGVLAIIHGTLHTMPTLEEGKDVSLENAKERTKEIMKVLFEEPNA